MRGAAIILLAGTAAGCSGQMSRFNSSDDLFTSSTSSQPPASAQNQPFPGDIAAAPASGTVSRGSLPPLGGTSQQASMGTQPSPGLAPLSSSPRSSAPASNNEGFGQQNVAAAPMQNSSGLAPANTAPGRGAPAQNLGVLPQAPKPTTPGNLASSGNAGSGYKVQSGDTLSKISRSTGVSVDALKSANGMQDGNIRIGQTLVVPGAGSQIVASAAPAALKPATQPVVSAAPQVTQPAAPQQPAQAAPAQGYTPPKQSETVIQQASLSQDEAPDATGIGKMRWPVRGRVISKFGAGGGKTSDGIDIAVPEGTSVRSAENGVVIYAGDGLKEFGNTVLVRHEDGLVTVYGHASALKVSRGDTVKRGQEIALSGMSGSTDSPKLHFEVRKNSSPVDPTGFLQ